MMESEKSTSEKIEENEKKSGFSVSDDIMERISKLEREPRNTIQFQDFIVVNGNVSNLVHNKGIIQGNIHQEIGGMSENVPQEDCLSLSKEIEFGAFFKKYKSTRVLSGMIVLSVLDIVPENLFYNLCQELEDKFSIYEAVPEDEQKEEFGIYKSLQELLWIIGAVRIPAALKTEAGSIEIHCISYADREIAEWVRKNIWSDYLGLRKPITEWIFSLKEDSEIRKCLDYQIVEGIASLAGLDFAYAMDKFIGKLSELKFQEDIKYITKILSELKKDSRYKENIAQLLRKWIREEGTSRWRIGYQLYEQGADEETKELLLKKLKRVIKKDSMLGENRFDEWYLKSRGYLLYPTHMKKSIAELFVLAVVDLFQDTKSYYQREQFAEYLTILFREDYFYNDISDYKMIFIDLCNELECRRKIKTLLVYVWQRKKYRDVLQAILKWHLLQVKRKNDSWEYMKCFFKVLAFTGEAQDFKNMIFFLEKNKENCSTEIKTWLYKLRDERI